MRNYRGTPKAAAALAPFLPLSHSLLDPLREALSRLHSNLPGRGTAGHTVAPLGSGGGSSAALAGVAKVAVVLVAATGGATAGLATGAIPSPFEGAADQLRSPAIERVSPGVEKLRATVAKERPKRKPAHHAKQQREAKSERAATPAPSVEEASAPVDASTPVEEAPVETTEAPVESSAPPATSTPAPSSEPPSPSSAGAAGEFGP
jgi:hypothetical protein